MQLPVSGMSAHRRLALKIGTALKNNKILPPYHDYVKRDLLFNIEE
jgi:hypothetical protein